MEQTIRDAVYTLYQQTPPVELTRPEPTFGDFATNVALKLAKPLGKPPRDCRGGGGGAAPDWPVF